MTKSASIIRMKWQISGVLGSKRLPFQTVERLKTRHDELKRLGGKEAVFFKLIELKSFRYQSFDCVISLVLLTLKLIK